MRVICKFCSRSILLSAGGNLWPHKNPQTQASCKGSGYQHVDLTKIPEHELTIEQRQRLRDMRKVY